MVSLKGTTSKIEVVSCLRRLVIHTVEVVGRQQYSLPPLGIHFQDQVVALRVVNSRQFRVALSTRLHLHHRDLNRDNQICTYELINVLCAHRVLIELDAISVDELLDLAAEVETPTTWLHFHEIINRYGYV